jgi:predicted DNA-binding transcriptional regulator YafY
MLASRLLSILMLLQTRGRMSATELAAKFEVSVRTIHRDIDQLSAAGVPVYADRGCKGGFQLRDGYRTKLTGLTQSEAEALFLAGVPGPAAQLGLADVLSAARLKLTAALPANMQPNVERVASRFHLDPVAWFPGTEPLAALKSVARAV